MKKALWAKNQKDYKVDPLFEGLPVELKDPAQFKNVLEQILKAGESGHEHKAIVVWMRCKHCQQKFLERKTKIKKIGFTSYEQFLKWRKIADIILNQREIYLSVKK